MKQFSALSKHSRYRFRLGNEFTTFIHSMYIYFLVNEHFVDRMKDERAKVKRFFIELFAIDRRTAQTLFAQT